MGLEMSEMNARVGMCLILFCFALLPISPVIAMADEIVAEGWGASVTVGSSMEKGPEDQTAEAAADVSEVGSGWLPSAMNTRPNPLPSEV